MAEENDNTDELDEKVDQIQKNDSNDNEKEAAPSSSGKRKRKRKRKKKSTQEDDDDDNNNEEDNQHIQPHNSVECTVYVEGIPFDAKPDQVREFFESNGVKDILELRLPTWQDSGRLRGYGHVLFESEDSFQKALKLSGKYLQKRYLTIQAANAPRNGGFGGRPTVNNDPPPKDCCTLFVHNLPYASSEEDVSKVFEKYGDIVEDGVRIARNSVTRQSKGFAYIDFASPKDAQKVMKACSKKPFAVGGRLVRLDYDTGRMKGSFRAQSGRLWTKEHGAGGAGGGKRQRMD